MKCMPTSITDLKYNLKEIIIVTVTQQTNNEKGKTDKWNSFEEYDYDNACVCHQEQDITH